MNSTTSTDRIHKEILINAPRARVWQALADARRFGQWFGVELDGPFAVGAQIHGKILDPNWAHVPFELTIERLEPDRLVALRWHPYAIEAGRDYSAEPTTLIEFELHERADGTLLTVDESGFDALPPERRAEAYRGNEPGWAEQMHNIGRYVTSADW